MTDLTSPITQAKAELDTAEALLVNAVELAIKDALTVAFEDENVRNVVFGVSTDPYNDENAGQGVFGPLINSLDEDEYFDRDEEYELFYNSHGRRTPSTAALTQVLTAAGWKYAAQALNVPYYEDEGSGRTSAFIARRSPTGYTLHEEEINY